MCLLKCYGAARLQYEHVLRSSRERAGQHVIENPALMTRMASRRRRGTFDIDVISDAVLYLDSGSIHLLLCTKLAKDYSRSLSCILLQFHIALATPNRTVSHRWPIRLPWNYYHFAWSILPLRKVIIQQIIVSILYYISSYTDFQFHNCMHHNTVPRKWQRNPQVQRNAT